MTEPLQYDPRTKQQVKDALYELLYTPMEKHFKDRLDRIIIENAIAGRYTHKSFIYRNEIYNCDSDPLPRKMNRLLPKFQPAMDEYLRSIKHLNQGELPYVLGYINQVLNSSNSLQDYLELLPEATHGPIKRLINTCPCRTRQLSDESIGAIQEKNQPAISLMRQRMTINLLL